MQGERGGREGRRGEGRGLERDGGGGGGKFSIEGEGLERC